MAATSACLKKKTNIVGEVIRRLGTLCDRMSSGSGVLVRSFACCSFLNPSLPSFLSPFLPSTSRIALVLAPARSAARIHSPYRLPSQTHPRQAKREAPGQSRRILGIRLRLGSTRESADGPSDAFLPLSDKNRDEILQNALHLYTPLRPLLLVSTCVWI